VSYVDEMWDQTFADGQAMITAALAGDEAMMHHIAEESDHPTQLASALAIIAAGVFTGTAPKGYTPMQIQEAWREMALNMTVSQREAHGR
jgi:hypothetical protein